MMRMLKKGVTSQKKDEPMKPQESEQVAPALNDIEISSDDCEIKDTMQMVPMKRKSQAGSADGSPNKRQKL